MKITYKDVGQGDSIILEWEKEGKQKIAIIDCNKKGRCNPVLEHIAKLGYSEIELIVLSHPHRDHFSGLLQLFNYIEKKGIIINKFAHTLHWSATNYWKYFESSSSASRLLSKTISKWAELKKSNLIKRFIGLQENFLLPVDDHISLHFLSPCHSDAEEYQRIVKNDADKNIKDASQAANHLSTVFLLTQGDLNILFTSDAEISSLNNILNNYPQIIKDKVFHLCQLPHHGSFNNHNSVFWEAMKTGKIEGKHVIASAGKHRIYNHPSFEVLKYFHECGYLIHCTNILNGMQEYTEHLEKISESSLNFDGGSSIAEEYRVSKDRVFNISENKIIFE